MFFFMYVIRIHESVDTLLIRRYNTLLTSFATFVRKNLYKTIKLPGFSKNSYLKKRVYSVHVDTGRKLIRCRCRIRCWGQKQGNSCYRVLIRNPSIDAEYEQSFKFVTTISDYSAEKPAFENLLLFCDISC